VRIITVLFARGFADYQPMIFCENDSNYTLEFR